MTSFAAYRSALAVELDRALTVGEVQRARNWFSYRIAPSALAAMIRRSAQR
jgi:hypothetical protein